VDEDSFHFVSYIPKDGYIWELDGLKIRPVKLAAITEGKHWLKTLGPILGQKMSDNDQCNILVAVKNPLIDMKRCLANYTRELESLKDESAAVQLKDQDSQKRRREIHEQTQSPCPKDQLQHNISILYHDINEREIQTQKDMLNMSRLKFDYFPFITQLISKTHQHQIIKLPHPPAEESAPLKITSTPKRRRPSRSSNNTKAPKAPRRPRRSRATKTPETEQIPKDPQVLKDSNDPKDLETQQVPNATDDNQAPPKEDPESPKATKATIAQKTPIPPRKSRRQKQEEQEEEADVIL
jgi:hypothetical protein